MKNGAALTVRPSARDFPSWARRANPLAGMLCPVCGGGTAVLITRRRNGTMQRRRACGTPGCGHRFTTREVIGLAADVADDSISEAMSMLRDTAALLCKMADRLEARQRADNEGVEAAG